MIIDSHHHFWQYDTVDYDWIDDSMSRIRQDFLPQHLHQTIQSAGVDGVVSVQARQTVAETDWLLTMAHQNDFIKGIVGWLPISAPNFEGLLSQYLQNPKLKALRHVIQGEADDHFILGTAFNQGIDLLKNTRLVYDILIFERHLPQTIQFVDKHPNQLFVLDHIAKPLIGKNQMEPWKQNIRELSRRPNVYCKVSGMVTEADYQNWTHEQLVPYFDVVLDAFGPDRLLFGSDWPVCLVAVEYPAWLNFIRQQVSSLSASEQASILGLNAIKVYQLQ